MVKVAISKPLTSESFPPGMRLAFWRLRMVSPTKKTLTVSAFWLAPLRRPRSHSDLVPVGSSSTLSFTFCGSLRREWD